MSLPRLALLAALLTVPASAQMLARPGWAGSGMTIDIWWRHSVFYQLDPHTFADTDGDGKGDLKGVTGKLDYIRSLGVDAVTLTHFAPAQGEPAARFQSIDPSLGTLEDMEDLIHETSRNSLRLLVELDPQQLSDPSTLASVARFWLGRGAGGIVLRSSPSAAPTPDQLRALRAALKSVHGTRILIDESPDSSTHPDADLTLNPALSGAASYSAAALHPALERTIAAAKSGRSLAATDLPELVRSASRYADATAPEAAKPLAALLLATQANAQILAGQEIGLGANATLMPWGKPVDPEAKKPAPKPAGPDVAYEEIGDDSVLNWYRRLVDIHHSNGTLHAGSVDILNHDEQNALVWMSRRGVASFNNPAVITICNLSNKPLTLSLTDDVKRMHLRGNFLRTVLRSDNGMGGMEINVITLQPYGVYIGELLY
ncbi:MAG TPA: alpha-amylase family glycosyl hydrolase [Granulicella sp.]